VRQRPLAERRRRDSLSGNSYKVRLKPKSPGVVQFKAAAPGLPGSDAVSVKIKA